MPDEVKDVLPIQAVQVEQTTVILTSDYQIKFLSVSQEDGDFEIIDVVNCVLDLRAHFKAKKKVFICNDFWPNVFQVNLENTLLIWDIEQNREYGNLANYKEAF